MMRFWLRILAVLPFGDEVVLIEEGAARAVRGSPRPVLLGELSDVCDRLGIRSGLIVARRSSRGHRLSFRGIPPECHQRLRNVWNAWSR